MGLKQSIFSVKPILCSLKILKEKYQSVDRLYWKNEVNVLLDNINNFNEQELENIFPIVTCDDWVVCRNEQNKQLYVICENGVFFTKVKHARKSKPINPSMGIWRFLIDFDFFGQSDDTTMYFWFDMGDKYEKN